MVPKTPALVSTAEDEPCIGINRRGCEFREGTRAYPRCHSTVTVTATAQPQHSHRHTHLSTVSHTFKSIVPDARWWGNVKNVASATERSALRVRDIMTPGGGGGVRARAPTLTHAPLFWGGFPPCMSAEMAPVQAARDVARMQLLVFGASCRVTRAFGALALGGSFGVGVVRDHAGSALQHEPPRLPRRHPRQLGRGLDQVARLDHLLRPGNLVKRCDLVTVRAHGKAEGVGVTKHCRWERRRAGWRAAVAPGAPRKTPRPTGPQLYSVVIAQKDDTPYSKPPRHTKGNMTMYDVLMTSGNRIVGARRRKIDSRGAGREVAVGQTGGAMTSEARAAPSTIPSAIPHHFHNPLRHPTLKTTSSSTLGM